MNNTSKVLASVSSAVSLVAPIYWATGTYLHHQLIAFQTSPAYRSLETTLANLSLETKPGQLTTIGTLLISLGLLKLSYEASKPLTRCFADDVYGAKLEERL